MLEINVTKSKVKTRFVRVLKYVVLHLLNNLLWFPTIFVTLPFQFALLVYRSLLECFVLKLVNPNHRPPDGLIDVSMCQGTSSDLQNKNIGHVLIASGKWISTAEFSQHFYKSFLMEKTMYKNLYAHVTSYGSYTFYSHCEPDKLDLNWHIRKYSLSDFGNGSLESFVVSWMTANTYEKNRPAWQIALLHLGGATTEDTETVIVTKFSHALTDGYSLVHLISRLTNNPAPYPVKDFEVTWKDKIRYLYWAPLDFVSYFCKMTFSNRSLFKAYKYSGNNTQNNWFMSFGTLNLEKVKRIRQATNTHFNCVITSLICGALRKLMLETQAKENMPNIVWTAFSLPWPNHPHDLTNHWTLGVFECHLRLACPYQRLGQLEANYRKFKTQEMDKKGIFVLGPLLRNLPTWARRLFLYYDVAVKNVPLYFSNLMLSEKPYYILGRRVKDIYLTMMITDLFPCSFYCFTASQGNKINLSISASKAVVSSQAELDKLLQLYLLEELNSLEAICTGSKSNCSVNISE